MSPWRWWWNFNRFLRVRLFYIAVGQKPRLRLNCTYALSAAHDGRVCRASVQWYSGVQWVCQRVAQLCVCLSVADLLVTGFGFWLHRAEQQLLDSLTSSLPSVALHLLLHSASKCKWAHTLRRQLQARKYLPNPSCKTPCEINSAS